MGKGILRSILTGCALLMASSSLHAQPAQDREAQIAEAVARLSPAPPDIRMPTWQELNRIAYLASRLGTPDGHYFRDSAYSDLLPLLEQTFGPDHQLTGMVLAGHANELRGVRNYAAARASLDRAEAILGKHFSKDDARLFQLQLARIAILDLEGRHPEQLEGIETLEKERALLRPDDTALQARLEDERGVALYRLGRFEEALEIGDRLLADGIAAGGLESPQAQGHVAGQVATLVAAGRLGDAQALLDAKGRMEALDEKEHRFVIARLLRARAGIAEALRRYDDARADLLRAHELQSGAAYRLPASPGTINPDSKTVGAIRTAFDLERVKHRKFPGAIVTPQDWMGLWTGLELDGESHYTADVRFDTPPAITDRISEMAVTSYARDRQTLGMAPTPAEPFWRAALAFNAGRTGEDSVPTARLRTDLARNLLMQNKVFGAQEEAARAAEALSRTLSPTHPLVIEASSIAAIALSRQGRASEALPALDSVLAALDGHAEAVQDTLLEVLLEKDAWLRRSGDRGERAAFWDRWAGQMMAPDPGAGYGTLEKVLRAGLSATQALADMGSCPQPDFVTSIAQGRKGMELAMDDGSTSIAWGMEGAATVADQIAVEAVACTGDATATARTIAALLDDARMRISRETGAQIVERYDRWADLVMASPGLEQDPVRSQTAERLVGEMRRLAEFQIELARGVGAGNGTSADRASRRAFASQGEGFSWKFAFEKAMALEWQLRSEAETNFESAFMAAQMLRINRNSQALALASARAATPDPELRAVVSRYQQVSEELYGLLASPGAEREKIAALQAEFGQLDQRIAADFPRYHEFAAPDPLYAWQARAALQSGEGLLMMLPVGEDYYVFAASKMYDDNTAWHRVEGGREEVEVLVALLRCDIDPVECGGGGGMLSRSADGDGIEEWEGYSFDRNSAWKLYEMLIEPVAHVFEKNETYETDTAKIYAVTSGPISALPLSLLLTAAPEDDGFDTTGTVFRDAPWLANRFEIAYLPSVTDLTGTQRARDITGGFIGYGDPVLAPPDPEPEKSDRGASLFQASRGGPPLADPRAIKNMKSLPGAARELEEAAALFPASARLVTRDSATEPRIRADAAIAGSQVILLATHGVLPDPDAGFAEPGLVMTPPDDATAGDDGLLSASEAAAMDFTSELLILSACNTASAGSLDGADSLSGLARSFIFAGAGSVYASHWRVSDAITKELVLLAIRHARDDPTLSRSAALGKAMAAIRRGADEDGTPITGWTPDWSHPSAWAPFVAITSLERKRETEPDSAS